MKNKLIIDIFIQSINKFIFFCIFVSFFLLLELDFIQFVIIHINISFSLLQQVCYSRWTTFYLITTTRVGITWIKLFWSEFYTQVRITPVYIILIICDWSGYGRILFIGRLSFKSEYFSTFESKHQSHFIVDISFGYKRRLRISSNNLVIFEFTNKENIGFVIKIVVEISRIIDVKSIE